MGINGWFFVAILLFLATVSVFAAQQSDQTALAVATDNGTSVNQTVTGRMEQYVAFFGNVSMQVRNNTAAGNVLYSKTVTSGVLYFAKAGDTLTTPFVNASTNATANGNFSFSGFYNLSGHFDTNASPMCGLNLNVAVLNTTDSRSTGILFDNEGAGLENYLFCTNIGSFTSTNGFSTINYEIIVAKTPVYTSYDVWFDLT